jgi:hypothetical protein
MNNEKKGQGRNQDRNQQRKDPASPSKHPYGSEIETPEIEDDSKTAREREDAHRDENEDENKGAEKGAPGKYFQR